MGAIAVWGAVHAVGAIYFEVGYWQIIKALIIYACVCLFLGFWGLMLAVRRRRLRRGVSNVFPPDKVAHSAVPDA